MPAARNGNTAMNHRELRKKLSAYIDGEVAESEKKAIEQHLQDCHSCRQALEALRRTVRQVQALEDEPPPDWLTQQIMDRVRAETERAEPFWRKLIFPLHIKLPLQAMAMVFLVVTGAYLIRHMPTDPRLAQTNLYEEQKAEAPPMGDTQADSRGPVGEKGPRSGAQRPAAESAPVRTGKTAPEKQDRQPPEPSQAFAVGESSAPPRAAAPPRKQDSPALQKPSAIQPPSLQKTLVVGDPSEAAAAIEQYLEENGGILLDGEQQAGDTILTVRIPSAALGSFLARLGELGRLREKDAAIDWSRPVQILRITITVEDPDR